jgi:5'-3' exonuclease
MDDLKLPNKGLMKDDFAIFIPAKKAIKFIDWFNKKQNREVSNWREFYEELIKTKILSQNNFPYVNYNYVGTVITPIKRTLGWDCFEILQYDILDLIPTKKQEKELVDLLKNGDTDLYKWADDELINNLGQDNRKKKKIYPIGEHTKWALNMKWNKE